MFQKRHMEAIAEILRVMSPVDGMSPSAFVQHEKTVKEFSDMLAKYNPNFKRGLFLAACTKGK